jgi:small subunit ribosomal protein S8
MLLDPLADACSIIKNAEHVCKKTIIINPRSKMIGKMLYILQKYNYIGEYEPIDDGRTGKFQVQLLGKINKIGVIKPRQAVKLRSIEEAEKLYLPAINFGLLIISTSKGIMSHLEAKEQKIGGRLIAYIY